MHDAELPTRHDELGSRRVTNARATAGDTYYLPEVTDI